MMRTGFAGYGSARAIDGGARQAREQCGCGEKLDGGTAIQMHDCTPVATAI